MSQSHKDALKAIKASCDTGKTAIESVGERKKGESKTVIPTIYTMM